MTLRRRPLVPVKIRRFAPELPAPEPLREAVRNGDIEAVRGMLKENPDLIRCQNPDGATPLHGAASLGRKELAGLLLSSGAGIEARDRWGCTPLIYAAGWGKEELVELLLTRGATIDGKDDIDRTALHWCVHGGYTGIAKLLISKEASIHLRTRQGATHLFCAAIGGRPLCTLETAGSDSNSPVCH